MTTHGEQATYDTLGGAEGIGAVVDAFYERILGDPQLSPYFADVDMARLHAHQVAFLSAAVGGPRSYEGRSLAVAHQAMDIPRDAFERVLDHLVDAFGEKGVALELIEVVVDTLTSLETEVAGRH